MAQMVHQLDLVQVIHLCREESFQDRQAEVGYCFELFRRALTEQNDAAWEAIQQQYQGLVLNWLRRAAEVPLIATEEDDLTQNIFAKFWLSLHRRDGLLSDNFSHVGALLKYLNRCTLTIFFDFQAKQQREAKLQKRLAQEAQVSFHLNSRQKQLEQSPEQEKLQAVREWAETRITDESEKLVYSLLYREGLKPRQIVERYPQQFPTAKDVNRVKARLLARARRALALSPK